MHKIMLQWLFVSLFLARTFAYVNFWPSSSNASYQGLAVESLAVPLHSVANILYDRNQSRNYPDFLPDYEKQDYGPLPSQSNNCDSELNEYDETLAPGLKYNSRNSSVEMPLAFVIGAVVPDEQTANYSASQITVLNFGSTTSSSHMTLYGETMVESSSPFVVAREVCERLIKRQVAVIIAAGGRNSSAHTAAISYTAGFYHIPVLSTSVRDSSFSNKNLHASLLRTVPPYSHQAAVWIKLLEHFSFVQVVFILSADPEGRATLRHFHKLVKLMDDDKKVKISSTLEFSPGSESVVEQLLPLQNSTVRVYLLAAGSEDSATVLRNAEDLDLVSAGRVWFLSETALRKTVAVPRGVIAVRLLKQHDLLAHLSDSLRVAAMALKMMLEEQPELVTSPPSVCCQDNHWNITGPLLYRYMKKQEVMDGLTGRVGFDSNGDRTFEEYEIVNAKEKNQVVVVGRYFLNKTSQSLELTLKSGDIVWPGGMTEKPAGYNIPSHLKVLSLEDKPFLMMSHGPLVNDSCAAPTHAPCYPYSGQILTDVRCCYGYCVHLLQELSHASNFTFDLFVSNDTEYGARYYSNGTVKWNGLVGDLLQRRHEADMIVAALSINPERAQVIDFSKPYKYQGIAILVKNSPVKTSNVSIVQPFHESLWIILLVSVHIIAVCVWMLDRCSPMYKNGGSESDSLTLSEACWLSWGVLLNSGMNEGTPRSLSARVLTLIWAGFAMILLASYTANLAAFLVLEEHTDTITGITDPKLRNPSENFTFGTVAGSSVDTYFRQKIELSNMYRVMNRSNVGSAQEGVNALLNGSLKAFIWDSSRLEYEASRDCNLVTVGDLFGRSGYGIGLTRGSPWADKITLDILHFHESGLMAELDDQWIWSDLENECPVDSNGEPLQLGLTNIEGMFFMVVGATITGTILVFIEMCYKRLSIKNAVKKKARATLSVTNVPGGEQNLDQPDLLEEMIEDCGIPEVALFDHKCRGGIIQNGNQNRFCSGREPHSKSQIPRKGPEYRRNTSLQRIGDRLSNSPNLPWECKNWTDSEWLNFYLYKVEEKIKNAEKISDISTLASSIQAREIISEMKQATERNNENNISRIQVKKMTQTLSTGRFPVPFEKQSRFGQKPEATPNSKSRHFTVEVELHHQRIPGETNSMNKNQIKAFGNEYMPSPAGSVDETYEIPRPTLCDEEKTELAKCLSKTEAECEDCAFVKEHKQEFHANACETTNIDLLPDVVGFPVVKEDCVQGS